MKKELSELIFCHSNDKDVLDLISSVVRSSQKYLAAVVELEVALMTGKSSQSPDEYRATIGELDKKRSVSHNALISDVGILNRLCVKAGKPPMFGGSLEDRVAVAEFARNLLVELFDGRRK